MSSLPEDSPAVGYWRAWCAQASYWLLFILGPLAGFLAWRGFSLGSFLLAVPLLLLLGLLGEHGLRWWVRLWRIR